MQAYSNPKRADDPHALPDIEVWEVTPADEQAHLREAARFPALDLTQVAWQAGFYWWSCFPGCLPDSDPVGPFATKDEALADAREGLDDDDEG